ncbi:MAG: energy transducer TonB [Desulfobacteraceae bacterium]|nr:energy transducer TonB [Desulfobacteraceae bacterium]
MKRILLSGTIALCLHIAFFISLPMLLQKNHQPAQPEIQSVMVTMSYRPLKPKKEQHTQKPVKKIVQKKQTTKQQPKQNPEPRKPELTQMKNNKSAPELKPETDLLQKSEIEQNPAVMQPEIPRNSDLPIKDNSYKNNNLLITARPYYKKNPLPHYPLKAKRRRYEGTVELMVEVSKEGEVINLWIFKSSDYKSLDNQAVKTVKKWLFEPAKKNGKPEKMWVKIPVKFELK